LGGLEVKRYNSQTPGAFYNYENNGGINYEFNTAFLYVPFNRNTTSIRVNAEYADGSRTSTVAYEDNFFDNFFSFCSFGDCRLIHDAYAFPNPTIDNTKVKLELNHDAYCTIHIHDSNGELVQNVVNNIPLLYGQNMIDLNIDTLPNGIYYVKIQGYAPWVHDLRTDTRQITIIKQ